MPELKNNQDPGSKLVNRVISKFIETKYALTEPRALQKARKKHEAEYEDPNQDPLVTIISAAHNRGSIMIERTLPALFAQTYSNIEVLIVGDHCIDNTPELMSQVKDPRLRFYDLPQPSVYPKDVASRWFVQGVPPRNKALTLAKGKWYAWISDDDVLLPHHIESLLRFAQEGNYEFVSAAYEEERYGKKRVLGLKEVLADTGVPAGGMQTWLYRSYLDVFEWNVNSWRKSWNKCTDYDLQIRMYNAGVRMGYLDKVVAEVPPVDGTGTVGLEAMKLRMEKEST